MESLTRYRTCSEAETIALGARLAHELPARGVVLLIGNLGAGKTTLAKGIASGRGAAAVEEVTSPTFTLVHEYDARLPVRHADLYRLGSDEELAPLGLREQRAEGAVLLVEWGEPYLAALGGDGLILAIAVSPSGQREARLSPTGPRSAALCRAP